MPINRDLMRCIPWRCSDSMASSITAFHVQYDFESSQQALLYIILAFLERPTHYSKLDVKALREPMTKMISVAVPVHVYRQIKGIASTYKTTMSEVIRMAVYQEVIRFGDK